MELSSFLTASFWIKGSTVAVRILPCLFVDRCLILRFYVGLNQGNDSSPRKAWQQMSSSAALLYRHWGLSLHLPNKVYSKILISSILPCATPISQGAKWNLPESYPKSSPLLTFRFPTAITGLWLLSKCHWSRFITEFFNHILTFQFLLSEAWRFVSTNYLQCWQTGP